MGVYNGISIQEIAGRSGTESSSGAATAQRTFLCSGTSDPVAARAALIDGPILIDTFDGMFRELIEWDQGESYDSWNMTVRYSYTPAPGRYTVSIDTTGGSILQTTALAQVAYPATGETAIDYGKAIDVQDGSPQGVERPIPALKINVRARISGDYTDEEDAMDYAFLIASCTGFMASGSFLRHAQGELLFLGATGDIIGEDPTLDFGFLSSKNITNQTIGDIVGVTKLGHDYLWYDFKKAKDPTTKMPITSVRQANVGRIFGFADLSVLKIGQV
ncbi:hypothetical protein RMSM_01523 [Rhodopirellula maiorica SM1]|uniref:Uncharacterized protein n=2 Tax=Rhodopirellula maiorica SM1 TaxID=1265738 RepID=M5S5R7_9BACT|nr:hypothetical protein RMSM_01523 [Rhodopirellula maiorica SM1]